MSHSLPSRTYFIMAIVMILMFATLSEAKGVKLNVYRKETELKAPESLTAKFLKRRSDENLHQVDADPDARKIVLQNLQNTQFYASLTLGDNQQTLDFLFDTGSPWLWVPLNTCANCRAGAQRFHPSPSWDDTGKEANVSYVSGNYVVGEIAKDQVRINPLDTDFIEMKMIGVEYEHDIVLTPSGIVGLSPTAGKDTDLFVEQLFKQGAIPNKSFGLSIKPEGQESSIMLGDIDSTIVTDPEEIVYIPIHDRTNWWAKHSKVFYGDALVTSKGGLTVFDSGTSITTISKNIFYAFLRGLFEKEEGCTTKTYLQRDFWHCPCGTATDFEPIGIQLGNHKFFLDPKYYVSYLGNNECRLEIIGEEFEGDTDIILLGSNFLFNYYLHYDIGNAKIGLYGPNEETEDLAQGHVALVACLLAIFGMTQL